MIPLYCATVSAQQYLLVTVYVEHSPVIADQNLPRAASHSADQCRQTGVMNQCHVS
jgi:hypothetical protein